jgi:hypothetical protein
VSVVPGKRTRENTRKLVDDFQRRTRGRFMNRMTSDEYPAYRTAILHAYGMPVVPARTGRPGRPPKPSRVAPRQLRYATVHQTRRQGRVVQIEMRVIFGFLAVILLALTGSRVSRSVNTSFVERHHGTDRNRNRRKVRKRYGFSKDWVIHEAVTYVTMDSYHFCWPVRTLRVRNAEGRWQPRTPAMEAGLTDHVWSREEWLAFPAVQHY